MDAQNKAREIAQKIINKELNSKQEIRKAISSYAKSTGIPVSLAGTNVAIHILDIGKSA